MHIKYLQVMFRAVQNLIEMRYKPSTWKSSYAALVESREDFIRVDLNALKIMVDQ